MSDGRVPRLAALVREALAVLAAILIAFALDAWWDERKEQVEMLEALGSVAVEIDRNIGIPEDAISYNEGQIALAEEALSLTPEAVRQMDDEELARFSNLPNYSLVELEFGAVQAFIEGGYLPALDDARRNDMALRAVIAGLPRLQKELDEEGEVMKDSMSRLTPLVIRAVPQESLGNVMAPVLPDGIRATLREIAGPTAVRPAFFERTFVLSFLYGGELQRTVGALQQAAVAVRARLDG